MHDLWKNDNQDLNITIKDLEFEGELYERLQETQFAIVD